VFLHTRDFFGATYRFRDVGVHKSPLILGARASSLYFGCFYGVASSSTHCISSVGQVIKSVCVSVS